MNKRFMIIILGTANGIEKDLNFIADGDTGVNYVDGKGMFICTFYSPYTAAEIHEKMAHRPAIMIFDITDVDSYGVNLPPKYYMGIFPEVQKTMDSILEEKWGLTKTSVKTKIKEEEIVPKIEEYDSIDEILDKLSRYNYDRNCLTEKEIQILNKN
jgi:ATP sulfurylase